ncbi:MAG: hypothetical protein M1134_02890 [Actinobacteria bacterium]|nr:hypothetical protein [Actinomycetota bacterium]
MPQVDWSKRAEYVRLHHGIDSAWANEAVDDDHAVWLTPDPAPVWEGGLMTKNINEVLADEGAAAENYEIPDNLPDNVEVSRPNRGQSTVVSVRLSAGEHARLQRAAQSASLPVSTLIRIWALDRLRAEDEGGTAAVAERLARLERAVFQRPA